MRDNFTETTKSTMAKRVGYLCTNPDCRRPTVAAATNPEKSISIGVAAHITAASPGGQRYDVNLPEEDRRSVNNGIWLCQSCSKLIDTDSERYPVELLYRWKEEEEERAVAALQNTLSRTPIIEHIPFLELDMVWVNRAIKVVTNRRGHRITGSRYQKEQAGKPIPVGGNIISLQRLKWDFSVSIHNNSAFHAYNLKFTEDNLYTKFSFMDRIPAVNNIPSHNSMKIKASYDRAIECSGKESREYIKKYIPPEIEGKRIVLEYKDEFRNNHQTEVIISSEGVLNNKI